MELGFIGQVKGVARVVRENGTQVTEVEVDPGGGPVVTPAQFEPAGLESYPLPGIDYAVSVPVRATGRSAVVGYADPIKADGVEPGEIAGYARDPITGLLVNFWWLRNDGSFLILAGLSGASIIMDPDGTQTISNPNGSGILNPDGSWNFNGATISPTGEITNAAGIVLGTHTHNENDSAPGPTNGPN